MLHKFIIFSIFLFLSSCGIEEVSKGLGDEKDEESAECEEARENRAAMDTLHLNVRVMKGYANNYEFTKISDYCLWAMSSRAKSDVAKADSEIAIAELIGEAYNQMRTLCDEISKISNANKALGLARKTNPNAVVIERSETVKGELLRILDQAKKTADDSIPELNDRVRESC